MKVYVWMPVDNLLGHSSLRLSNGTYISWWPDEGKEKQLPLVTLNARSSATLTRDIESEGRRPTHIFHIKKRFRESQIQRWWDHYKFEGSYILGTTNCCWVVYKALTVGGAPWCYNVTPWKPSDVKYYCESLWRSHLREVLASKKRVAWMNSFSIREVVWKKYHRWSC